MLKTFAMLSVFFYCTYLGYRRGRGLEERVRMLEILMDDLNLFRIHLQHDPLQLEALLKRCSNRKNTCIWVTTRYIPTVCVRSVKSGNPRNCLHRMYGDTAISLLHAV